MLKFWRPFFHSPSLSSIPHLLKRCIPQDVATEANKEILEFDPKYFGGTAVIIVTSFGMLFVVV
jgi:hypothetical protein